MSRDRSSARLQGSPDGLIGSEERNCGEEGGAEEHF